MDERVIKVNNKTTWQLYMIEENYVVSEERWIGLNLFPATEKSWFNLKDTITTEWIYDSLFV